LEVRVPMGRNRVSSATLSREREKERKRERTSASRSSMDHEESNGRRNGDGRNRWRRYLGTKLGRWKSEEA